MKITEVYGEFPDKMAAETARMQLISSEECFYLLFNSGNVDSALEITKMDYQIKIVDKSKALSVASIEKRDVEIFIGIVQLLAGEWVWLGGHVMVTCHRALFGGWDAAQAGGDDRRSQYIRNDSL
jgi:hypothetical protein